jgi:hypothetical protein
MPRYFFDIDDGEIVTEDDEGLEVDGLAMARDRAIAVLPNIARDVLPDGDRRTFIVTVRNTDGANVFQATLVFEARWLVPPPA